MQAIVINLKEKNSLMDDATLLVIEGKHSDNPAFVPALLNKGFSVELASNGGDAAVRLSNGYAPDVIVVNAASMRSSGRRICQSLREKKPKTPILLILDQDQEIDASVADTVLALPFTAQKLVNRLRHLLPEDGKNSIHAGLVHLDIGKRIVRCQGKRSRLTPRLVSLLKILIERQGEVIDRRELFSKVWETDYTEDTRTLDVHISWLRHAIEFDPDHPKIIRTVRGVGYRLDV
jgi:DNA-binding response OmpR family regulator